MKIDKKKFIDINIKDPQKYTQVALLVDKDSFLNSIYKIREQLGLDLFDKLTPQEADYQIRTNKKLKEQLDKEVESIRQIYNKPIHFLSVIEDAIVYKVVGESSFTTAYLEETILHDYDPDLEEPEWKFSIVIYPGTLKKDVEAVFDRFNKEAQIFIKGNKKQKDKLIAQYRGGTMLGVGTPPDTRWNIKQIREWYIRRQNNETPLYIALKDNNSNYEIYAVKRKQVKYDTSKLTDKQEEEYENYVQYIESYRDNVKQQIQRYKKLLKHY